MAEDSLPIDCVNWFEAYAFCIWDGGFLPSEAEWEYAAAGGSAQRRFPWGSTQPGPQSAIIDDTACDSGACFVGAAAAGAGRWGQLDLSGEVEEWCLDYEAPAYVVPSLDGAYLNPSVPGSPGSDTFGTVLGSRVLRGGDWNAPLRTPTDRDGSDPTERATIYGFRCARSPSSG